MDGGGLIFGGGVGFVLFCMWRERHAKFLRLLPVEQNLRRASHGLVLVIALTAALFAIYGWQGVRDYWPWLQRDPADAWPGLLLLGPLGYGLVRFFFGACAARRAGPDGFLATRGFLKCAGGLAVTIWLGRLYPWPGVTDCWVIALMFAAFGVGAWCVIVGATRFFLTAGFGGGNPLRAVTKQIRRNQTVLGRPPGFGRPALRGLAVAAFVVIGGGAVWFLW
jgi:hypothetical protein